jgi:two-component system, chemotaxis family, chemotaxis protein CheY
MDQVILVVDDSASVRKFVSIALEMQGFRVVTACDGMEALEKLPSGAVNLVITDLNMPNMDGFEFVKTLRETPVYQELPVVILTSLSDDGSRQRGKELGANSFLVKPFSLEKVQYEVSKYLNWTANQQQEVPQTA